MSARGRPIRFVGLVCIAWIGTRVALLWPETGSLPAAIEALLPRAGTPAKDAAPTIATPAIAALPPLSAMRQPVRRTLLWIETKADPVILATPPGVVTRPRAVLPSMPNRGPAPEMLPSRVPIALNRWSASGWLAARNGRGTGAAPGGQLGGGQAGVRVAYLLAPRQRVSLFARVTAPLAGKGKEGAIGIEWRPWKAPIRLALERRIADGTPGGIGAGVIAGLYRETSGLRLESYGQAGVIARGRIEPYADGAIRVTRPVTPQLALGAGAWGGAQHDAQRLDIGPSATLVLGKVRLSLDWRQRIAGRARPGSGPALTLGGDF